MKLLIISGSINSKSQSIGCLVLKPGLNCISKDLKLLVTSINVIAKSSEVLLAQSNIDEDLIEPAG